MFYSVYDLTLYTLNSKCKTNERYMHRLLSKEVIAYYVYRLKFGQQSERTEDDNIVCNEQGACYLERELKFLWYTCNMYM